MVYNSVAIGDHVVVPGNWNGVVDDPTGSIFSIAESRAGCVVMLDQPFEHDGLIHTYIGCQITAIERVSA